MDTVTFTLKVTVPVDLHDDVQNTLSENAEDLVDICGYAPNKIVLHDTLGGMVSFH